MAPLKPPTLRRASRFLIVRAMARIKNRARKTTTDDYEEGWVRAQGLEIRVVSEIFLDCVLSETFSIYSAVCQNAPTLFTSTFTRASRFQIVRVMVISKKRARKKTTYDYE